MSGCFEDVQPIKSSVEVQHFRPSRGLIVEVVSWIDTSSYVGSDCYLVWLTPIITRPEHCLHLTVNIEPGRVNDDVGHPVNHHRACFQHVPQAISTISSAANQSQLLRANSSALAVFADHNTSASDSQARLQVTYSSRRLRSIVVSFPDRMFSKSLFPSSAAPNNLS